MQTPWLVLLLGGASGVGKTSVSYRLAQHYQCGLTEVDDFQSVLEGMTHPVQYPVFHYWRTHTEEALRMDEGAQLDFFLRYASTLEEALSLVVASHIETGMPIILEGDFILPSLVVSDKYDDESSAKLIRAVFLYEDDEAQIARNYLQREGRAQPQRAHTSFLVSEWLRVEAERLDISTIPARPWESVLERAIEDIDSG